MDDSLAQRVRELGFLRASTLYACKTTKFNPIRECDRTNFFAPFASHILRTIFSPPLFPSSFYPSRFIYCGFTPNAYTKDSPCSQQRSFVRLASAYQFGKADSPKAKFTDRSSNKPDTLLPKNPLQIRDTSGGHVGSIRKQYLCPKFGYTSNGLDEIIR